MMTMPLRAEPTLEQTLLLECLRAYGAQERPDLRLFTTNVDWAALWQTALEQGVLPLLYSGLKELAPGLPPQQEMANLRELFKENSRKNLLMAAELVKVFRLLRSHSISAIPFKGPVLAVQAYGDLLMRQFADLDFLVGREDIKKVEQVLSAHGYQLWHAFTPAQEKSHLKRTCEFTFLPVRGPASIDVHWRFAADYFTANLNQFCSIEGQEAVLLEGHAVSMLPADIMLLYLCLHGTFHLWPKLSMVCDIARLITASPRLDWQRLLHMAAAAGLRRIFLLGLGLAQDLMATKLPAVVATAVAADQAAKTLQEHARARLFARHGTAPGFAETAWFHLLAKDRFSDRVRYCCIRMFFPTIEDWKVIRLPDRLYFIYFFLRLMRLSGLLPSRA
ncbi:MAG: nucleotidyltransferase family protein [Deltaproteobacteria bacterium]|nr:nucleotidyltransferase family protein [Deltaproteobacteria bacterium]